MILERVFWNFLSSHHYYTAIYAGIYTLAKKDHSFRLRDLFNYKTLLGFSLAFGLHAMWNGSTVSGDNFTWIALLDCFICVSTLIVLINIGVAQERVVYAFDNTRDLN